MATFITNEGKYNLFKSGWKSKVVKAYLYDADDTLINSQDVTMVMSGNTMVLSEPIVFDVASGANDVSYVVIGDFVGSLLVPYYQKDLPALYDFPTAGTLTINTWVFSIGGIYTTTTGKTELLNNGWESKIEWAKLYTTGNVLVNTQSTTFATNSSTGAFNCSADIVFPVTGGTTNVSYISLGYTNGSDVVLYQRTMSPTYNYPTEGTLRVDDWSITI